MGSSYSPPSSAKTLKDYTQYLPGLLQATGAQDTGLAQDQFNATAATTPETNALNLQQAQQFSLPLAQVGQQVTNSNALAGAQTNLNQIQGAGGQAALAAQALNQQANPAYYNAINSASGGASNAINAINLNGLSPGEYNATERSLNQSNTATGNLGLDNATNAVSNAMNFGGAFNSKIGLMNNATNAASTVANAAAGNGGLNAVNVALGQPNASTSGNFGTGTFSSTTPATNSANGTSALNFGSGLLGNITSANNAGTAASASTANGNSVPSYLSSLPSYS